MASATQPPATPAPADKKNLFETIVTATPVLLTVIATFMIGRSSGEMTQAQYHRAVASQNQSKVGDQWGFYQAKRIRGEILAANVDMLLAQGREPFSRETIIDSAWDLVAYLRAAEKNLGAPGLADELKPGVEQLKPDLKSLIADAEKSLAAAKAMLDAPSEKVKAALEAMQQRPGKRQKAAKEESTDEQVVLLNELIADIRARKHEKEMAPKVLKLHVETLEEALKDANKKAEDVYRKGKGVEDVLDEFDALVDEQTALAFRYQRIMSPVPRPNGVVGVGPQPAEKLDRRSEAIRTINAKLHGDYKAARNAFGARRNEADARSNQRLAELYEVRVLMSSARSDKHLFRSYMFLAAMLIAQVGVTIATLAMAVRRKSPFWLLATLVGVLAIGFGVYVLLDLPVPTF